MSDRKMEEKKRDADKDLLQGHEKDGFVCPVCKRILHEDNLVDVKSVIDDNLCYLGGVRIVNCKVKFYCDFEHRFDEEGFIIEKPHKLVAVIDAVFDDSGRCIQFDIQEVRPK